MLLNKASFVKSLTRLLVVLAFASQGSRAKKAGDTSAWIDWRVWVISSNFVSITPYRVFPEYSHSAYPLKRQSHNKAWENTKCVVSQPRLDDMLEIKVYFCRRLCNGMVVKESVIVQLEVKSKTALPLSQ